jgi:putative nucleotidyltransferase with HDIG domain
LVEFMQSFSVLEVFLPRTLGQRNLWIHALQTAVAARTVANLCPELEVPPERAYLAGLLHDIGRFVMFRESAAELGEIDETMGWNSPHALVAAEQQICGYDHAELGWLACQKWKIPEEVGMLIRDHHVYDSSACLPPEVARLMRIVQTADILSVVLLVNSGLLNRKLQEQYPVLDQALSVRSWTPPIDAGALAPRLPEVDAESHGLAASLGLVE